MRDAFDHKINVLSKPKPIFQPNLGNALDRMNCDVNSDPFPPEGVSCFNRRGTAAEGIKNNVADICGAIIGSPFAMVAPLVLLVLIGLTLEVQAAIGAKEHKRNACTVEEQAEG
jgi:hypothetical protein